MAKGDISMKPITRRAYLKQGGLFMVGLAAPQLLPRAMDALGQQSAAAPTSDGVDGAAAPTPYELQTPRQVLQMDVPASIWGTRFTQLVNQGYRPIWIQGSTNSAGAATYSAIWIRDGRTGWVEWQDMDAATYQNYFTTYASQGYRPISVSGYQSNGANLFAAIWLYDPGVGYSGIHNASSAQYQTFVNNMIAQNYVPQVVDGYAVVGPSDNYISIWANTTSVPWVARHGLTSAQYQSEFNAWVSQGYRITCVSAYQVGTTTYFAAFFVKDGLTDFYAYHDALPGTLFANAVNLKNNDYVPIVIEGYDTGSTRNFAGVWIKKARTWTTTGNRQPEPVVVRRHDADVHAGAEDSGRRAGCDEGQPARLRARLSVGRVHGGPRQPRLALPHRQPDQAADVDGDPAARPRRCAEPHRLPDDDPRRHVARAARLADEQHHRAEPAAAHGRLEP
jgi:hypothetical protein